MLRVLIMLYGIPVGYPDLWLVKESPHTLQTKLWSTAETPFLQVPCTGAHNRNSGTSSFKTNRAHDNNCIKNVLAWLYIATGFPDANVAARNHARRWQQQNGGSAIRKTENGFIFLINWLFAVLDRPSCPHQVLLAVMSTHRSKRGCGAWGSEYSGN